MIERRTLAVPAEAAGERLDHFVATQLEGVSRSRVQLLIEQDGLEVNGQPQKPSFRLRGGEQISITGEPHPAPLKAVPEAIPLDVVYEDDDLAVVNKPAGMMVHAGSGATDDARSRGTLVNALLHRFQTLSSTGGELRPGIVHRLDKQTSGLIVVAKNDRAHAALGAMFAGRRVEKTYIALVHGAEAREKGTVSAALSRDPVQRTRMTTRPSEHARSAVRAPRIPSHPGAINIPKSGENIRRNCGVAGAKPIMVAKDRATRAEIDCRGRSISEKVRVGAGWQRSNRARGNQALRHTRVPANSSTIPLA